LPTRTLTPGSGSPTSMSVVSRPATGRPLTRLISGNRIEPVLDCAVSATANQMSLILARATPIRASPIHEHPCEDGGLDVLDPPDQAAHALARRESARGGDRRTDLRHHHHGRRLRDDR